LYDLVRRAERKMGIKFTPAPRPALHCTEAFPRLHQVRHHQWGVQYKESSIPSVDQIIVWMVVGLIGGALVGTLMTWERAGFGLWRNLGLGLVGALIGGLLFRVFGIWPGLDRIAISLRDVVAAVLGSLIVLAALWLWRKFRV